MNPDYQLTFSDYLSMMRRRAPYLIGIFFTVFLGSIIVAIVIPPTFRATGTIIVDSPEFMDNVVPTSVRNKLDDQINDIMQRMMTRENILQLANKHHLFNTNINTQPSSVLIDKIRKRVFIETDNSNSAIRTNRQGQQAIAFTLSFEDRDPDVALHVTKDLISLFLDINAKLRTENATEATAFLTQESDKLKAEVDRHESLISVYKQEHKNALPEQLTLRMTMLSRAENDMREVERDTRTVKEAIRTMEVELDSLKHGSGVEDNSSQSLPALKAELARISAIYTESHPDVIRLKRKIEGLEKAAETPVAATNSPEIPSLAIYKLQAKIDSDKARLISLAQQREMLQRKIAENESAMIQTPKVGQELEILTRDRDIALKKFEEIRSKRMNAKIAENLESDNKSGNFSVLEYPILPEKPYKPNRFKIILIGLFLAIASSGGIVIALETTNKRIQGVEALTHVLGTRPLSVIPYLPSDEDNLRKMHQKQQVKQLLVAAVLVFVVFLAVLHFVYMPIDILFIKILSRFG